MSVIRRMPPLPSIGDIMRMYGIRSKKKLSQNFLLDPRALDKIARTTGPGPIAGKYVVEVGPGPGGITRAIIGNGARELHVIEKDTRFLPSLQLLQEASGNVLHIHMGDVLRFNMTRLFPEELKKHWTSETPDIRLVGNLPFNIATPLLIRLLRSMRERDNIFAYGRVPCLLTFQHEVAARMIAAPGDLERCRLSVICQNYAKVNYRYTLPGGAFLPPPKVDVGIVSLIPLRTPYIDLPFDFVERVVTSVFRGKQKYVFNSAKNLFPDNLERKGNVLHLLSMASIKRDRTPISLTMNDIEKICYAYQDMCDKDPIIASYVQRDVQRELLAYQEEHGLFLDGVTDSKVELLDELVHK